MKKCLLILGVLVLVFTTSFSALAGQTVIDSKKTLSVEKSLISTSSVQDVESKDGTTRSTTVTDMAELTCSSITETSITINVTKVLGPKMLNDFSANVEIYYFKDGKTLTLLDSQKISESNNFLSKNFTLQIPMKAVVEYIFIKKAKVDFDNPIIDDTFYFPLVPGYDHTTGGTRVKQYGGAFNGTGAMNGHRHHGVSTYVYSNTTVYKYPSLKKVAVYGEAPVILMSIEDHQQTSSYGGATGSAPDLYRKNQLALIKQGKYLAVLDTDIADVKSKFPNKYNKALDDMRKYAVNTLGWK